jgi:enoyl-CoA hydratase
MTVGAPSAVRLEIRGDVAVAGLDDGKANALSFGVISGLRDAIRAATSAGRPLVVTGNERSFCAGFDLTVMSGGDRDAITALLTDGAALYRMMCEAPIPVVAACTGHALAGGALVLLSADYRVGPTGQFKIGLNEVRLGIALPRFAAALVRHRLRPGGDAAALFAEIATPQRAVEIGYLDLLAPDPVTVALEFAGRAAAVSGQAFAVTKQRLRAALLAEFAELGL